MTRKYAEGEQRRRMLQEFGYDPDDPTYSVELFDSEYTPVTATETEYGEDGVETPVEEGITSLKIAIQAAIEALQKVQELLRSC